MPLSRWWRHPQKVWLRRAIFQVHLWVGVALTLYAVVIGLSGSALVFREQIERALHPALFRIEVGSHRLAYAQLIADTEQARPGWRVSSIEGFQSTEPVTFLLRLAAGVLAPNYRVVIVDPYKGVVLADKMRFAGALGLLANLHFYLLAGHTGLLVNGWISLALAVLCLTGVVVWWPGVSRFASVLWLHPRRRWRRLVWDLHAVTGFWSALPLLLLSITGCYFAFPKPVTAVLDAVLRSQPPLVHQPSTQTAIAGTRSIDVDKAIACAEQLLPREAPLGYFALPAHPTNGSYAATGYVRGAAPYSELVSIRLREQDGALISEEDTRTLPTSRRVIQHFFAWHFGSFADNKGWLALPVRALWVLIGLAPPVLALTALLLFSDRGRRWRRTAMSRGLAR